MSKCRGYHITPLLKTLQRFPLHSKCQSSYQTHWPSPQAPTSTLCTSWPFHLALFPQAASGLALSFPSVLYHFSDILSDQTMQNSTPSHSQYFLAFFSIFFSGAFITTYILYFTHFDVLFVYIVYGLTSLLGYKSLWRPGF